MAAAEDEIKIVTLTARLLKPGREIEGAFATDYAPGEPKAFEEKEWPIIDGARLFVGEAFSTQPGWLDFVTRASPQAGSITKATDMTHADRIAWADFRKSYQRIKDACVSNQRNGSRDALARSDGLELALTELEDAFQHYHEHSDDGDRCGLCGLDIRNEIHTRA